MANRRAEPGYLMIANMLRADIARGRFVAGDRLPSETQLMIRHDVSRSVAKWAVAALKADGLVEGRQGAGVYVRTVRRVARHQSSLDVGQTIEVTERIAVSRAIAERLAIMLGDLVIHTRGRCLPAGGPIRIVEAWRPASDSLISESDRCQDRLLVRPATPIEIKDLCLPSRGSVIVICRSRLAGEIPVETSDIIVASDRIELVYDSAEAA